MTTLKLNDVQMRVVYAALHELDTRLRRGLANSQLDEQTVRALWEPAHIHESEVSDLRRRVLSLIGGDSR